MAQQTATSKPGFWSRLFTTKTFMFGSYAALLAISIPHMAYFFASFTNGDDFEWGVSIGASVFIEASIYVSTYAVYKKLEEGFTKNGNWLKIPLLILWNLVCSSISWLSNVFHAVHFMNPAMISGTQVLPFSQYYPAIAGAWPILGIIFALVSKTVIDPAKKAELEIEEKPDTRTPQQIFEDAQREVVRLKMEAVVNRERAKLKGQVAGAGVQTFLGTIGSALQRKQAQPVTQPDEDNEDDFEQDFAEAQKLVNKTHLAEPKAIVLPPTPEPLPPPHEEDVATSPTSVFSPPSATPIPILGRVKEVRAKDVGYSFARPHFTVNGVPYATLGKAFGSHTDGVITQDRLKWVFDMRKIDSKYLLFVLVGQQKHRAIVEHEGVRKLVLEAIRAGISSQEVA